MGELADRVARLEREVMEAQEALRVVAKIDEEIENALEEIEGVTEALLNLSGELDGEIADHNYPAVERCAYELWGLVDSEQVRRAVDTVALLTAVRDGHPLPAASMDGLMDGLKDVEASHPTLTQGALDQEFQAAIDRAESTWKDIYDDGSWDSEDERNDHLADHMHEARQEATSDRAARAGRFLMELCDHLAETVWPEVTGALRRVDIETVARALKEASLAGETAPAVYKLYEINLSVQYKSSPYSLGAAGEQLMAFESWLGTEGRG
ncbi:hypothetical protein FHX79_114788 [Streptomyces cavourensis]|uniref:hypothetical protein n=1 Tax=Streptomyces TaxID=1883 RepID=UPI00114F75BB|nr:hypothetical protein [Streptomyces cavourensis]MBH0242035.1 hypothetical protein [Streptomyces cavourensis]TQO32907.1 hypothetical protein FHX79_114788 [Streptomyces cavourensis]GGU55607.1 hypothetical protein GCM10010498_10830 [Streptomyces cavourensis]